MKKTMMTCGVLAALCAGAFLALPSGARAPGMKAGDESRIVTLYAHDDLQSSFDFTEGGNGATLWNDEIVLDDAQIAFHVFAENMISYGFVRNAPTMVLDLGEVYVPELVRAQDWAPKLPISLFHTLFLDGAHFSYREPGGRAHRLKEAGRILNNLPPEGLYHLEPRIGHTYLVRTNRRGSKTPDEYAKFQVIDFQPDRSLTIRWANLPTR